MGERTCGDCQHLDGPELPTSSSRKVFWCSALMSWQFAPTPRGEPTSVFYCDKWTQRLRKDALDPQAG